jgi:SAM-dependent methyltransferase
MENIDYTKAYRAHVSDLGTRLSHDDALREAIGSNFVAIGKLEYHLLRSLGLIDGQLVVDVGCGCGRLAVQLAPWKGIRYLGCDIVPELLDYARDLCKRPDWNFVITDGIRIPVQDKSADFTVFFSVFTHLLHEDTFRYFRESSRALKPGGLMVLSFLEFKVPNHWHQFIDIVEHSKDGRHLNQFIDRDGIQTWADHSGFEVVSIRSGDAFHIPIPEEIQFDNGDKQGSFGTLGQSVAVLKRKA